MRQRMDLAGLILAAGLLMSSVLWLIAAAGVVLVWRLGLLAEFGLALLLVVNLGCWAQRRLS